MKKNRALDDERIKGIVQKRYAKIAEKSASCCGQDQTCCGPTDTSWQTGTAIGYSEEDLKSAPGDANLGLGCGNPVALASLAEGETVLDLGSGAGLDCFLAAQRVGAEGKVIGIDMTKQMVEKARENARKSLYENVEFRLGEIEDLPLGPESVDVVISNCVINLSPDKKRVFEEAFRVLKPGGRIIVSDMVLLKELPESIKGSVQAYAGCIAGAMLRKDYLALIENTGFQEIDIKGESYFSIGLESEDAMAKSIAEETDISIEEVNELARSVLSIKICAFKPKY